MLPPMAPLRLTAAATTAAVLTAAAVLGASCGGPNEVDCTLPTLTEMGVDGGPDPCHCDPPPSLNIVACQCLNGGQSWIDAYNACMTFYRLQMDAGAE
jgi:hypothetical protein